MAMALYNNMTGVQLKMTATGIADEVERYMLRWKYFADKLTTMTADDMTALGLSADYQTYLGSLRVALLNIELKYRNQAPLNADDPSYFVKLFTDLTVF
jgi:hypothetical protein